MNTRTIVDRGFAGLWGRHSQYFGRSQDEVSGLAPLPRAVSAAEQQRFRLAEFERELRKDVADKALVRAIGRAFG